MNRYVTRGQSTSLGLTGGMGSLFSAPVLPADLHTMTEMPATSATSRQSTNENALKRVRRTTSTNRATPAVMAAVSAMCANGKTAMRYLLTSSPEYGTHTPSCPHSGYRVGADSQKLSRLVPLLRAKTPASPARQSARWRPDWPPCLRYRWSRPADQSAVRGPPGLLDHALGAHRRRRDARCQQWPPRLVRLFGAHPGV